MSPEESAQKAKALLEKFTKESGKTPDECTLDDLVHDTASTIGSNINNQTMENRVQYLQENGVPDKDILEALSEE